MIRSTHLALRCFETPGVFALEVYQHAMQAEECCILLTGLVVGRTRAAVQLGTKICRG